MQQKRRIKVCQSLDLESPETSYSDILQRLVRRYLFKLERQKDEGASEFCVSVCKLIIKEVGISMNITRFVQQSK